MAVTVRKWAAPPRWKGRRGSAHAAWLIELDELHQCRKRRRRAEILSGDTCYGVDNWKGMAGKQSWIFDREDAQRAGKLRAHLSAVGIPIGPYDVLIAGQAWARGLTLITRNIREFQRVPCLQVEDWET